MINELGDGRTVACHYRQPQAIASQWRDQILRVLLGKENIVGPV